MLPLPIEYDRIPVKKRLCTFDTETDPFAIGRVVKPFTCGFHIVDSGEYFDFWGDDCIEQFFEFLDANFSEEPLVIYTHNGGNFDFYFMLDHFDKGMAPFIINGRLTRIYMHGQEFRDSYSAIPVALEVYKKTKIRYRIFERDARNRPYFKAKIRSYQRDDCVYLGQLISAWLAEFGNRLTMASVALPQLRSFHGFERMSPKVDEQIRDYYYGGRVQCFETGVIEGDWKIYDVNSMYPYVMAKYMHPVSAVPIPQTMLTDKTCFAKIRAWSDGALPMRMPDGSLQFPTGTFDFYATKHEIDAGLETGLLRIDKVYEAFMFDEQTNFREFVEHFYARRLEASAKGDDIQKLFLKLVLNSSYGKLAQDPRKYEDYLFDPEEQPAPGFCQRCYENELRGTRGGPCDTCSAKRTSASGWSIHTIREGTILYSRPQSGRKGSGFFNVSTAASITGAARATLLRGIASATRPIYCDTDSIICSDLGNQRLDDLALGAWKIEASGDTAAIAGKKLYAVFNGAETVKKASKGVKLTAEQIERVAQGEVIEYANPVPKFNLDGTAEINRTRVIQMTGNEADPERFVL